MTAIARRGTRSFGATIRVIALLVARGARIDRAKEIAHDAWTKLIENHRGGRLHELRLPGLVFRQATFLAIDAARRGRFEVDTAELPDRPDPAAPIDDVLAWREQLVRAGAAFAQCSAAEQRIFRALYERPDHTCREIAIELGLSEQRVKQVAHEVRKRIRGALDEEQT